MNTLLQTFRRELGVISQSAQMKIINCLQALFAY